MVGLLAVTVFYSNGTNSGPILWSTTPTCTTAAFCGQANAAVGNGAWTLTVSNNTGSVTNSVSPDTSGVNPWTLTTNNTVSTLAIASVSLNGVVSSTTGVLFGRDFLNGSSTGGTAGTPGDGGGLDFTFASAANGNSPNYNVTVQYTNIATLIGAPHSACGGNWSANFLDTGCQDEYGTVNFTFGGSNFIATSTLSATNFVFFQDTDEVMAPEPSTMILAGMALLALALSYRLRKTAGMNR